MSLFTVFVGTVLVVVGLVTGFVVVAVLGLLLDTVVRAVLRAVRTWRVRRFLAQVARDRRR